MTQYVEKINRIIFKTIHQEVKLCFLKIADILHELKSLRHIHKPLWIL